MPETPSVNPENIYRDDPSLRERNEFEDPIDRDNLILATERLAEVVRSNDFENILFIDTSARPAATALREYWRLKFPDEEMPGMYFINPFGAKTGEDVLEMFVQTELTGGGNRSLTMLSPLAARSREEILREFKERYAFLYNKKDKPLLLFDTCAHSGASMSPVIRLLQDAGFSHIVTALVSQHDNLSPNITLLQEANCYPFGKNTAVLKHQGGVESLRAGGYNGQSREEELARERAARLRENIKNIIRESVGNEDIKIGPK